MAVIHVRRRMVPMTSRVRRVGCKKSVSKPKLKLKPKPKKSLSSKREFLRRIDEEWQMYLQQEQEEVTAKTDCSAEADADVQDMHLQQDTTDYLDMSCQHSTTISAEGGHSDLHEVPLQHNTTNIQLSAEGGVSDLQDMPPQPPQNDTALTDFSVEEGNSDLHDIPLPLDTTETQFLSGEGNSHILDMLLQERAAATQFSAKGDNPELGDMPFQHGTAGTRFLYGDESDVKETSLQFDTAVTKFSSEKSESYVPDTYRRYDAAEGSNDVEVVSEGVSQVNKWACCVCKSAEVSIAVLPCHHLCLCLNWVFPQHFDSSKLICCLFMLCVQGFRLYIPGVGGVRDLSIEADNTVICCFFLWQ